MKKTTILLLTVVTIFTMSACARPDKNWQNKGYDLSIPVLDEDGWYLVFEDDFDGNELNEAIWTTSPHGLRWKSDTGNPLHANYWCADMVRVEDGYAIVKSYQTDNHVCSQSICPRSGRFSGGFETRKIVKDKYGDNQDEMLFSQAYGYFETRVKFPDANGLWSAFWLQSSNQRKIGSEGCDGTEIDVFESAFRKQRKSQMGHALLWDGYGKSSKVSGHITTLDYNLYDGFHTFALKWTPSYYVFYIDGVPTWATNDGGVAMVKEFLRFTVEIDAGDKWGPHGMKIGDFEHNKESEFFVDYIKVYQNENYKQYIIDDAQFPGFLDPAN